MDEDKIALVLARTLDLRSKITNCIQKTGHSAVKEGAESESKPDAENQEDDEEEETESLLNIRDALESLEGQLSALQALQQQQWYEKESALSEIEYSQKKLLKELKEYKGNDLEVIHEAIAFASETEEYSDLLLPPYPTRPSHSDNVYLSSFTSARKFTQNGALHNGFKNPSKNIQETEKESWSKTKGVKFLIGAAAKTVLTVVGVIAILSLAGFEPKLRKRDDKFKLLGLFKIQKNDEVIRASIECPPGKVQVVENGEIWCVVKERVEIPFESDVATPDVNYGCG